MNKKIGKWVGLTVHHSAGSEKDNVESMKKYHVEVRGYGDIGYHYVLEIKDGHGYLKKGRSTDYQGAHAGVPYYNANYLGLCVCGNYVSNNMSDEIYSDLIGAICTLVKKYKLTHLNGHKECKSTKCPGKIDLDKLRVDVNNKLNGSGYKVKLVK